MITIMDDGGGIDADQVRRKAIERGLLQADEALSDRDAIQLDVRAGLLDPGRGHATCRAAASGWTWC